MSRIWFLRLATVAVGAALVVGIEGLLRLVPGLGPSPLVVTLAEDEATGESLHATSRFYAQRFFTQYKGRLAAAGQMGEHFFLEPSPANRYRVVFVGASTVQGFPHPRRLAAASFLQVMLADAWPEREVEVVNWALRSLPALRWRRWWKMRWCCRRIWSSSIRGITNSMGCTGRAVSAVKVLLAATAFDASGRWVAMEYWD